MKWVTKAKQAAVPPMIAVEVVPGLNQIKQWDGSEWVPTLFDPDISLAGIPKVTAKDAGTDLDAVTISSAYDVTADNFAELKQDVVELKALVASLSAPQHKTEIVGVTAALEALSKAGVGIKSITQHSSYSHSSYPEIELTMTMQPNPSALKELHEWAIQNGPGGKYGY